MRPINRRNITDEVKDSIVAIALRYPQRGPRRLALLLRDRISVTTSSINGILHQKDLRSCTKRIERGKSISDKRGRDPFG